MISRYTDPRGDKPISGHDALCRRRPESARRNAFCGYRIGPAVARKPACRNYFYILHFRQHRFDKHLLLVGLVKTLGYHICLCKDLRDVVGRQADLMSLDQNMRIYPSNFSRVAIDFVSLSDQENTPAGSYSTVQPYRNLR